MNEQSAEKPKTFLDKLEPAVVIIGGVIALVIPAVVALVGYSYAVRQLQTDFETRSCDLELRLNSANSRVKFFELERERRALPEPNEYTQSPDELEASTKKILQLESQMDRALKVAKFYDEAQANGMQKNCDSVKLEAMKL